jgi:hypothetical protein
MLKRTVLRQVTRRRNHRAQTEGKLNKFSSVRAITSIIRCTQSNRTVISKQK